MDYNDDELAQFLEIIGRNIKGLRHQAKKKIATVATDTDIPIQDLLDIEAGRSANMNARYLLIICDYYQVDFDRLFEGW